MSEDRLSEEAQSLLAAMTAEHEPSIEDTRRLRGRIAGAIGGAAIATAATPGKASAFSISKLLVVGGLVCGGAATLVVVQWADEPEARRVEGRTESIPAADEPRAIVEASSVEAARGAGRTAEDVASPDEAAVRDAPVESERRHPPAPAHGREQARALDLVHPRPVAARTPAQVTVELDRTETAATNERSPDAPPVHDALRGTGHEEVAAASSVASTSPAEAPPSPAIDLVALEAGRLREAQRALRERRARDALRIANTLPADGPLAIERETVRVLALCALGEVPRARAVYTALDGSSDGAASSSARLARSCAAPR
jgi:hypothetical protein